MNERSRESMENSSAVRYERKGWIGEIVLDRPDNRNSMTPDLLEAFMQASRAACEDESLRCLLVRGEGSCFSAGADFRSNIQQGKGLPHERSYSMYQPFLNLLNVDVPVIAALNGHAVGGGFGLALVCDIRIANRAAKYGANFARLGLGAGMAITYLLPRLINVSTAAELLFTGRLIDGDEMQRLGLASAAVSSDEVVPRARQIAEEIAQNAPLAVRAIKQTFYRGLRWTPSEAAYMEAFLQAETLTTKDANEGMNALLEKRDPIFEGC